MSKVLTIGIDLGSTTVKLVAGHRKEESFDIVFSSYKRHHAKVRETISGLLNELYEKIGDHKCHVALTGSAGMGITESTGLPFVQEVVASANYLKLTYPETKTFIEIGGEDSKIIFFDEKFRADMKMNGSCAGGTGAFLDQIAVLLNTDVENLNDLAKAGKRIFPIASRCGVFAKTDVQSLLSQHVSREDIAKSAFHAVALQVLSTLTRGYDIKSTVIFAGGPLTFSTELRKAFVRTIGTLNESDYIIPENSQLIPAIGTALSCENSEKDFQLKEIIDLVNTKKAKVVVKENSMPELFKDDNDYKSWLSKFEKYNVNYSDINGDSVKNCYLGIDSGSTTTKIILIDDEGAVVDKFYHNNQGDALGTVAKGLREIKQRLDEKGYKVKINYSGATGYGEGLIKAAFGMDMGMVETLAHYRSASQFEPDVSFIMDIGGQDMKAMFIRDNYVADIQVNEACSSGCGSFIETFARTMKYNVADFAELACTSKTPYDLGTRCTVFMNTKVKQALREGVSIEDIAAGLSFSIIKNSLYKVLKIDNTESLGGKILVQGGTFKNNSVLRAFEMLTDMEIIRPDIPELMGAYGAALLAKDKFEESTGLETTFKDFDEVDDSFKTTDTIIQCKGCENHCQIKKIVFENGNVFYTGNNCERIFSNNSDNVKAAPNFVSGKREIIFKRDTKSDHANVKRIGIPRILNMFENYPFWAKFFNECGFDVVLSDRSNIEMFEAGVKSVMSENICFPAKIAHGHILNLIDKKIDRIFFPNVVFENVEYTDINNSYNCPVVTGYPCVIRSSIDPEGKYDIPLDSPAISFMDKKRLKIQLSKYMKSTFGVSSKMVGKAIKKALAEQVHTKQKLINRAQELIDLSVEEKIPLIVLAGRPYHIDKLINHGLPELISELGAIVIPEDCLPVDTKMTLSDVNVLTQWTYTNRLYAAAKWVADHPTAQMVQITSFGCGPDAVSVDEVKEILQTTDKLYTQIKVDEVFNIGAAKIRIRSMLEALKKKKDKIVEPKEVKDLLHQNIDMTGKKIIAPFFSDFYSSIIPRIFKSVGVDVEILPPQSQDSIDYGIKNINNEICYPALLIAGDIISAFEKGNYDRDNTIVLITQTGGQCRASNYVALIRKGLEKTGYGDIKLDAISTVTMDSAVPMKKQKELLMGFAVGILVTDALSQMYLSTRAREKFKGSSKVLHDKYLGIVGDILEQSKLDDAINVLKDAVEDFNRVEITSEKVPQIGLVGEIFVKYNSFAHMDIMEWISDQGAEVILPPIQGFFFQELINAEYKHSEHFDRFTFINKIKVKILENFIQKKINKVCSITKNYRFFRDSHDLRKMAHKTKDFVSLANQFGEGWLLTADMLAMLEDGIENIVSVQPFGCISNHIVSKGVEGRIRQVYPNFKLLALDFDQSTSPANIFNRLHFLVASAKEEFEKKDEAPKAGPFKITV